jgi:hypothetical protein
VTGISDLSTVLSVLTGLIACAAFLAATGPGARLIIFLILSIARRQTVVRAALGTGLAARRSLISRAVREIVTVQYAGTPYNLAIEMEWLCKLYQVSLPVVMTGELADRKNLQLLATGYERLAGHCRARLIFGAKGNDVIARQARVADQAAALLHEQSLHLAYGDGACPEVIDRRARGSYIKVMYAAASMECVISPHPARLPSVPGMLERATPSAKPRFEGILPFLLTHRLELDGGSGRTLLHLGIGEIPYSNLLSRNTPWDPRNPGPPAEVAQHAVSLAVIPVTSDGRILLSRRAPGAGSYAGMIGPYVTGNAELRDRRGLAADRDEYGIPDLLRAACREGREEAGLSLEPSDLKVLGLAQIWSEEDTGIYCLLLSATLSMTAAEAVRLTRYSDPVEGSWEVGDEVYAVSVWEDDQSVHDVLRWITTADEVIGHAVACVAALVNKTSAVTMADLDYAMAPHSGKPDRLINVLQTHQPYR